VISLGLGFLVFKAFEEGWKTRAGMDVAVGQMDANFRRQVEPLLDEMKKLQKQVDSHKLETQAALDQSRAISRQEVDSLRQDSQRLAQSLDLLTKQIDRNMQAYNQKLIELNSRVQALEKDGTR
jgi:predicted  nucleic acid-binding Zn-ribbon protein